MSDKLDREAAELIRHIAGKVVPVLSGTVKGVDGMVAQVQLTSMYDEAAVTTVPVLLNLVDTNMAGVYMVPANNSDCEVCQLDGPGKWTLLRASKYDKIVIQAGTLVQLNDGSKKGLVVLDALVSKINVLERDLNNIKAVFASGWVPVRNDGGEALKTAAASWAGSNITLTTGDDIENKKVTHG